jgi:hypothetical protein
VLDGHAIALFIHGLVNYEIRLLTRTMLRPRRQVDKIEDDNVKEIVFTVANAFKRGLVMFSLSYNSDHN